MNAIVYSTVFTIHLVAIEMAYVYCRKNLSALYYGKATVALTNSDAGSINNKLGLLIYTLR